MPSRVIREGIIASARVNALSLGAEVLYRRLMSVADDYGRYHGALLTLMVACFPTNPARFREKEVGKWFNELLRGDDPLVKTFLIGGITYLEIQDFGQQRRGKSKFPHPPWFQNQHDGEETDKQEADGLLIGREAVVQPSRSRSRSRISKSESESEGCGEESLPPPAEEASAPPADAGALAPLFESGDLIVGSELPQPEGKPARRKKKNRTSEEVARDLGCRLPWFSHCWSTYPDDTRQLQAMIEFERKVGVKDQELARRIYLGVVRFKAFVENNRVTIPPFCYWLKDERWNDVLQKSGSALPRPIASAVDRGRKEALAVLEHMEQVEGKVG